MSPGRTVLFGLLLVAFGPAMDGLSAEPGHKAKRGTSARQVRTAPDVTATIGKPAVIAPPPKPPSARDSEIPAPVSLPVASRARYRACGESWRNMKLAGTTGDDDWRDFALKCLVGKGPAALAD